MRSSLMRLGSLPTLCTPIAPMMLIRDIVQQALTTGCLTVSAEAQLRHLLQSKYEREDFHAFMTLQQAVMAGTVRQESREFDPPCR